MDGEESRDEVSETGDLRDKDQVLLPVDGAELKLHVDGGEQTWSVQVGRRTRTAMIESVGLGTLALLIKWSWVRVRINSPLES